jgi:thiol-disulfide isomerase/thioredoxin
VKLRTNLILSLVLAVASTFFILGKIKKEKAPQLPPLTGIDGKAFDPATLRRKVYIISYFQTWCSDCVKEQPQLQKLQDRYGREKLQILMVSDESSGKIDSFRNRFSSKLDFYHSSVKLKSARVGVKGYPTTYLISKKGEVEEKKVEGINWYTDEIISLVDKLLK